MVERTFTLEEIKAAFWNYFKGAGELWFPEPGDFEPDEEEDSAERAVDDHWTGFLQKLPPTE